MRKAENLCKSGPIPKSQFDFKYEAVLQIALVVSKSLNSLKPAANMPGNKTKEGETSGDEKRKRVATPDADNQDSDGSRKSRRTKSKVRTYMYSYRKNIGSC